MRLDTDLIRGLMLQVEGHEKQDLSTWSEEQKMYHTCLLIEAGLIRGVALKGTTGQYARGHASDLTREGHEFLANARNERLWPQVKDQVAKAGGSLSLQVIGQLLTSLAAKSIGL
jgi:hypothetical protein